jgi:hypothetical protein
MAIEKTIELNVDSKGAQADFGKLADAIQELNKTFSKFSEDTTDGLEDVKKGAEKTSKGVGSIGKTLKNLGSGLGVVFLLNKAFEVFKKLAEENQLVMDAFNTVFEVLSIAFNDFFSFVIDNSSSVVSFFKAIFQDPLGSIKDFGRLVKENIIERMTSTLEVAGHLGTALKKLFTGDFKGAIDSVKDAGKEMVDVFTGVDDSADKIVEGVNSITTAVTDYATETVKAAQENVKLAKASELAAVKNQGLIESYDRQAELLRQTRDDESKSIEERIKANEDLALVLDEQEKAMKENAAILVRRAEVELAKNKESIELQRAYQEALNEQAGIEAQITGFRSEQQTNTNSLLREQKEIAQELALIGKSEREIERQELLNDYEAKKELINREVTDKIEKDALLLEAEELYKGQLNELNKSFDDEDLANKKAVSDAAKKIDTDKKDAFIKNSEAVSGALNGLSALVGENAEAQKGIGIAQAVIDTYVGANKAIAQGGIAGTVAAVGVIASGLANVITIAKTKIPKPKGASGGGSASASTPSISATPTPPSFNVVGATETSVLSDAVAGQTNVPVKAYVVSNDVTTAQSLDNNIIEGATI